MSSLSNTPVPPVADVPLVGGQQYQFTASSPCTVCFAVNPDFQPISGKTYQLTKVGQVLGPFTAPNVLTDVNWNVVGGVQPCNALGVGGAGKTIHVTSLTGAKEKK